jgi:hypothetical protein
MKATICDKCKKIIDKEKHFHIESQEMKNGQQIAATHYYDFCPDCFSIIYKEIKTI